MEALLNDKLAVVTGGASGIGRAIARQFAGEGADVVIGDIREEPREGGTPTHEIIENRTDSSATFVECDVSDMDDLEELIETAEDMGDIDVMVNNTGILKQQSFFDVTESDYDQIMDVNVKGMFFGSQLAAQSMLDNAGEGVIINLSSAAGLQGSEGFVTYCTSKGAVRLMTYALADELGPEIRVNTIHPGPADTYQATEDAQLIGAGADEELLEQIPLDRFGEPEDIADAALFLASDYSSYMTATSVIVDGGLFLTG